MSIVSEMIEAIHEKDKNKIRRNLPEDIRAAGWTVAVHNDYKLNGVAHTFWLFTKDSVCAKGEGLTDGDALDQVRQILGLPLYKLAD